MTIPAQYFSVEYETRRVECYAIKKILTQVLYLSLTFASQVKLFYTNVKKWFLKI